MDGKRFDLGELYDELRKRQGCYVLYFDIRGLYGINEISREAGDMVILESLSRIESVATGDMLLFRAGGDEFALVTGLLDREQVRALGERVLARNGESVVWERQAVPVNLCASAVQFNGYAIEHDELYEHLRQVCERGKEDMGTVAFD